MGSVLHTLVFHMLLWTVQLLKYAAFCSATDVAFFKHAWLPQNYTYIDVGVSVDVTTLVKCAAFSQHHPSKHDAFDFQQGKCTLYMLPVCIDLNSVSALLQSTGIGVGVFSKSKNSQGDQKTVPVNPPTINIALGKTATKSSPYGGAYPAEYGNDGDLTTFFHTDQGPWWRVDLKLNYCVQAVNLINRGLSSLYYRANNMSITVAETEANLFYSEPTGVQDNLCGYINGQLDASAYIRCHSVIASRFVQVQNNIFAGENFHLAEVEVFGV